MYHIVRKVGDAIAVVADKWAIASNARNWAKRKDLGKEGQDYLVVGDDNISLITDAESFDLFAANMMVSAESSPIEKESSQNEAPPEKDVDTASATAPKPRGRPRKWPLGKEK